MNKIFLTSFVCIFNVVSFGQIISSDTVVLDVGTIVLYQEWTTDHVILPVKKTEVEMKGLKGPVTFFNEEILQLSNNQYGFSKSEIFKETIDYDFNGKKKSCQSSTEQSNWRKFEFERDKNGFIHSAEISNPYGGELVGIEYYKYDSLGNVSATRMENIYGQVESLTFKFYNKQGDLIEEKRTEKGEVVFWEKYLKSNGKINIEDKLNEELWQGDLNEKGDVIRLVNREKNKNQEFTYVYDNWGNWTSRMKSLNGTEIQEIRRTFNYETYAERVQDQTPVPVNVGKQVWMSENLNVKKFNNGDLIEQAQSSSEWIKAFKTGTPAWCYCQSIGDRLTKDVLYNYFALTDPRGLAPKGYRIATLEDWNILFNNYGGIEGAFEKLKDAENDVLKTADIRGYRRGTWFLPETYWWTKDGEKILLAVDYIGTMEIFGNDGNGSGNYGLFIRCVKE